MTPDERVEAVAKSLWWRDYGGGWEDAVELGASEVETFREDAHDVLAAAGVDDLEAENARLRDEVGALRDHHREWMRFRDGELASANGQRDDARRHLADLRAVVARVVRQGGGVAALREHLNAMPAPTQRESI